MLGDPVTRTDQIGRVVRTAWSNAGDPTRVVDPQGNVTTIGYDADRRVHTVLDPIRRTTTYDYDPNGNLSRITDPRANAWTYGYDTSDRLTSTKDPLNRVTGASYDGNGNVSTVTSASGKLTSYTYDNLDRLTLVKYGVVGSSAESQTTYGYDTGNRVTSIVDSAGGTITLTPDSFDRVSRAVTPQGQIDYTYDAADRRSTMTVAGQAQVTYGYNNADQLTSVVQGSQSVSVGYDTVGRRSSLGLPAGVTQAYAYDDAGQVTGITYKRGSTTLGNLTYGYDADGHPNHIDGTYARVDLPAAYGPASYDAADQLTTVGATTDTYNVDGRLTNDGTATYSWNARGQLTGYARTGLSATYGYDGMGRRTTTASGATTTAYLYDGLNPVQEKNGAAVTANMLTGHTDEVFSRTTSAGSGSLFTDALGCTLGIADTSNIVAEYSYQPFGATTVSGSDLGNPTRFTGRSDDGTGLYYDRARYYSTGSSRFISTDPLGAGSGDSNPYTYVFNQPTDLVDPFGTKPEGEQQSGLGHDGYTDLYHGTSSDAAASIRTNGVDTGFSSRPMDFGNGFYTTRDAAQAAKWATSRYGGDGVVLQFRVPNSALDALHSRTFAGPGPELDDFVRYYRGGGTDLPYDMVEGPMLGNPGAFMRGKPGRWFGNQVTFFGNTGSMLDAALQ